MVRVLHLADVHLGASFADFGQLSEIRRQEVLDGFRALPKIAEAESIDAVLIAGDLFDSPRPTDYTLAVVRQTLRHLVDAGRPVFMVPGNHDTISSNPALYNESFGGATVFRSSVFGDPVSVETSGGLLHVHGVACDWAKPDPLRSYRRPTVAGTHVVLLHGSVPDAPHWRGWPNSLRLPMDWLSTAGADYIALGDWHMFRAPYDLSPTGRIPACYSGSFAAVDMSETGPHGYVIAELESGRAPRIALGSSRVRPVIDLGDFDVSGLDDEVAVAEAIAERIEEPAIPVVRLRGEPSFALHASRVSAALEDRFGRARVLDDTWYASAPRLDELVTQDTIAAHVVRLGRRGIDLAEDQRGRISAERALRFALKALRVS